MRQNTTLPAFTLIEVLVVIALIAVLAAVTIIAINPQQNFQDARNTERQSEINQISSAIIQYTSEDGQTLDSLATIIECSDPAAPTPIGTDAANVDLSSLAPEYIPEIPVDPSDGTDENTGYDICQDGTNNRVTITAASAEGLAAGETIEVVR